MRSWVLDLSLPKVAPFGQGTRKKRGKAMPWWIPSTIAQEDRTRKLIGMPSKHPLGSVESQGVGGVG